MLDWRFWGRSWEGMRGPPQTEAKDTKTLLRPCQDVGARQGQAIT